MTRRRSSSAAICLALIQLTGCGGGGGSSAPPPSPPPPPPPPVNAVPIFGALNFNGTEDTDLTATAAATDPEGAAVTFSTTTDPTHGTLVSFNATTGAFLYRPANNYSGTDSFNVRAVDPAGNAANGTVNITTAALNDAPTVNALTLRTDEDVSVNGVLVVSDVEGQALTESRLVEPANGVLQSLDVGGSLTYVPNRAFSGTDNFRLRVSDAGGAATDVTVNVDVTRTRAIYNGLTTPVTITPANAAQGSRVAWLAFKLVVVTAEAAVERELPPGAVDVTINADNGGRGGTLRLRGTLGANSTGTLTGDFVDFLQDGVTLNGRVIYDVLESRTATAGRVRATPKNLQYRDESTTGLLSGSLLRVDTAPNNNPRSVITGELLLPKRLAGSTG